MSIEFETFVVTDFSKPMLEIKSNHKLCECGNMTNMFAGEPHRSPMVTVSNAIKLREMLDQFISDYSQFDVEVQS